MRGLLGGLEGVKRPFQRARKGWEGPKRLGVPPRGLGWVGRPTKRSGRGWEALLESQEGLGG